MAPSGKGWPHAVGQLGCHPGDLEAEIERRGKKVGGKDLVWMKGRNIYLLEGNSGSLVQLEWRVL